MLSLRISLEKVRFACLAVLHLWHMGETVPLTSLFIKLVYKKH